MLAKTCFSSRLLHAVQRDEKRTHNNTKDAFLRNVYLPLVLWHLTGGKTFSLYNVTAYIWIIMKALTSYKQNLAIFLIFHNFLIQLPSTGIFWTISLWIWTCGWYNGRHLKMKKCNVSTIILESYVSRWKTIDQPFSVHIPKADPIVHTASPSLPKLEQARYKSVSTPI